MYVKITKEIINPIDTAILNDVFFVLCLNKHIPSNPPKPPNKDRESNVFSLILHPLLIAIILSYPNAKNVNPFIRTKTTLSILSPYLSKKRPNNNPDAFL